MGGFRGAQNAKVWKIDQTAGPIGTKFGTRLQIHLGMDIGYKQLAPRYTRGAFGGGGFRGQKFKSRKIYRSVEPIGTKFGIRLQIHMGMVIG